MPRHLEAARTALVGGVAITWLVSVSNPLCQFRKLRTNVAEPVLEALAADGCNFASLARSCARQIL